MSRQPVFAVLLIIMISGVQSRGNGCDTSNALRDLILSFNVDSPNLKSTYSSTTSISLGATPAKAITYNIVGLNDKDRLALILIDNSGKCNYKFRIVDTFDQEGVMPEILGIFNVNADSDRAQELAILTAWHYDDLNFRGYLYKVSLYDYPLRGKNKFRLIESVSDRFQIEREGLQMDKRLRAKYNTEAKIRRRLKELGYRQYVSPLY